MQRNLNIKTTKVFENEQEGRGTIKKTLSEQILRSVIRYLYKSLFLNYICEKPMVQAFLMNISCIKSLCGFIFSVIFTRNKRRDNICVNLLKYIMLRKFQ